MISLCYINDITYLIRYIPVHILQHVKLYFCVYYTLISTKHPSVTTACIVVIVVKSSSNCTHKNILPSNFVCTE